MVTFFCKVWKRTPDEELIEAYRRALRNKTDDQVRIGGHKCMEELTYFPKPAEIIARMPMAASESNEDFIIRDNVRCGSCGSVKRGIKEPKDAKSWECRVCYTGLTDSQVAERFNRLGEITGLNL